MSKNHKFKVGDEVRHNNSTEYIGDIHEVRNDPKGYDYFVRFIDENDETQGAVPVAKDWFKEEVLVLIEDVSHEQ